ncbi:glycosyltransferase family 2 protein [Francisella philomiragia]|uniref:Glycosyltransferase n=1 Tax=Francisella philomiragia TaxID=28110 RepID=A0ABS1G9F1_9GAMM|nr:glycosyltransferase [Francisella philomiragia]MBK2257743.1 glycosyltransferase [Francisella philomiragia]MBK2301431.1 glycosyltransferase [Francisella philomiragia]
MFYKTESEVTKRWKDDKVLLSIICVAYNHERYIEQALDSFLIQETNFAFEIVINDDCSTDNTARIIKAYQDKYPKIIKPIYQKENCFQKNINFMKEIFIPVIQGVYIALCEGDDYWTDSYKLQKQVDFLEANPEFMGCSHNTRYLVDGRETDNLLVTNPKDIFTFEDFINSEYLHTSSMVYRYEGEVKTKVNKYLDLLPINAAPDSYFLLSFSFFGPIKFYNDIMSVYRCGKQGVWISLPKYQRRIKTIQSVISYSHIFGEEYKDKFLIRCIFEILNTEDENKEESFVSDIFLTLDKTYHVSMIKSLFSLKKHDDKTILMLEQELERKVVKINECNNYINQLEKSKKQLEQTLYSNKWYLFGQMSFKRKVFIIIKTFVYKIFMIKNK